MEKNIIEDRSRIKVAVGLSGGVDSSVAAYLLKEQGYDVTGVYIKCWDRKEDGCASDEDKAYALQTSVKLGIKFDTLDFVNEYKRRVIKYFYDEYERGRTPNPDVICNREIKFGMFFDWAEKNGFRYIATGHYACINKNDEGKLDLLKGMDKSKDQSYFLYLLKQKDLHKIMFPIGELKKSQVREIAKRERPKLIIAGASAYPRIIDFKVFREIADETGAYFMVDMAHIAGIVAAGLHPNPVDYADFVTTTTHKTLRGPRGGMILCRKEFAQKIDKAIFPGTQGGPLMHVIAAKAACFNEVLNDGFVEYQKQVLKNAKALSQDLMNKGFRIVSGGTDNHLMLVDVRNKNLTGKEAEKILDDIHITTNKNTIPFDPESPFVTSGLRMGTPAVTTKGMKETEMTELADIIDSALSKKAEEDLLRESVLKLTSKFN